MSTPPLTQLGRYQLTRVLGRGAMGLVYEGLDPRLNRAVAVKTILKGHLMDAELAADYSARFVREAQAAARLTHPHIVTVFDFGEQDDVAYLVMELVQGRELAAHFDGHDFFDLPHALRIMGELLDALGYAHQHGIVHRDVKPANVMIDRLGRVKLTDFGVARLADAGGADRTQPGTMVGTPSYMSPEQIQGLAVGSRADLFAAGVILYQFLTRQKPFTGGGLWTIQKKIVQEAPLPPSFANRALPPVFDAIVQRALAKNPADRYATAADFAADLKRALADTTARTAHPDATVVAAPAPAPAPAPQPPAAPSDPDATLVHPAPGAPPASSAPTAPAARAQTALQPSADARPQPVLPPAQPAPQPAALSAQPATSDPSPSPPSRPAAAPAPASSAAAAGPADRWQQPRRTATPWLAGGLAGLALVAGVLLWRPGSSPGTADPPRPAGASTSNGPATSPAPAVAPAPATTTSGEATAAPTGQPAVTGKPAAGTAAPAAAPTPPGNTANTSANPSASPPTNPTAQPPAASKPGTSRPTTTKAATAKPDNPAASPRPATGGGRSARCADLLQRVQLGEPLSTDQQATFDQECRR